MGKKLIIVSVILFLLITIVIWNVSLDQVQTFTKNIILVENIKSNNKLVETESKLNELYNISKKNVLYISKLIELDLENNTSILEIEKKLKTFIDIDPNYFQARLINTSGIEVIRVDIDSLASSIKYQDKSSRYYFKESIKAKKNEVYISHLDLNIEKQKIEIPYRPTIRFFTPVYVNNELQGIVGLNLNAKNWFKNLDNYNLTLLNSRGEIFYGNDDELYKLSKIDLNKKDENGNNLYVSKTISLEGNHPWTIYTSTKIEDTENRLATFKFETYKNAGLLNLGLLIFLIIVYSLYIKNENISNLNQTVENRLSERDTLLKEIHHRVKNNLQVITSLLSLQSSFIKDEETRALFRYSQYRINSMAIIHEMLYRSNDLSRINYGSYMEQLANTMLISMKGNATNIKLDIKATDLYLNLDTSVPLGLMINEIITNSLKYGFKDIQEGVLSIEVKKLVYPNFLLLIGDNGKGFPKSINFRNTKSLGLKLIHKLALQLRGNIEKDNSKKGTNYIITFQEIEQTS
ncbi:sensor histidine kinase [Cellulophaga omnivescoria]|uniref:sensor histidine kinase n=1 Tax=Cellulophaga omnivescoria TaxID=1888890 RepID=UPI000985E8E1|nr:sensor histidine kinase [Cellulophaga omnivescoria]